MGSSLVWALEWLAREWSNITHNNRSVSLVTTSRRQSLCHFVLWVWSYNSYARSLSSRSVLVLVTAVSVAPVCDFLVSCAVLQYVPQVHQ